MTSHSRLNERMSWRRCSGSLLAAPTTFATTFALEANADQSPGAPNTGCTAQFGLGAPEEDFDARQFPAAISSLLRSSSASPTPFENDQQHDAEALAAGTRRSRHVATDSQITTDVPIQRQVSTAGACPRVHGRLTAKKAPVLLRLPSTQCFPSLSPQSSILGPLQSFFDPKLGHLGLERIHCAQFQPGIIDWEGSFWGKAQANPPRLTLTIPPRASAIATQQHDDNDPNGHGGDADVVDLFNWIHDGNPPPLNAQNLRLAGNADWLRPGQVVGPDGVTVLERWELGQMGPEGLGRANEGDNDAAYEGQEELQDHPEPETSNLSNATVPAGYIMYGNGESRPEVQVLRRQHRSGLFLLTLAAGCRECLPNSTTSTTMVANPTDVFRALAFGIRPDALTEHMEPKTNSFAEQAQLCTASFNGRDEPEHALPLDNPVLANLVSIVGSIVDAEILDAIAQLIYWVNAMHFAAQIMRQMIADEMGKIGHAKVGVPLLQRYYYDGTVVAMMAAAGSMYLVIVMACCRVRQDIRALNGEFFGRIARELRAPHRNSPFYRVIVTQIIPGIAHLMKVAPLTMSRLAPNAFMVAEGKLDIDCTDMEESDTFFKNFALNDHLNPRDKVIWAPAMVPNLISQQWRLETINSLLSRPVLPQGPISSVPILSSTPTPPSRLPSRLPTPPPALPQSPMVPPNPPTPPPTLPQSPPAPLSPDAIAAMRAVSSLDYTYSTSLVDQDAHIIKTDFSYELNETPGYSKTDEKLRWEYTQRERKSTEKAVEAEDIQALETLLTEQLASGKRKNRDQWVEMDTDILQGRMLRIDDKDGDALLSILPPIPQELVDDFFDALKIIFPDFKETDSKAAGKNHLFPAVHCDIYGRYSNRGDGVPSHAAPSSMQKENKKVLNTCQALPRTSQEWNKHSELFLAVQKAGAPIFDHIRNKIHELFPGNFEILSQFIDRLPCNFLSPVDPFAGFVLNLNVATRIHRDRGDSDICLVLVFSDAEKRSDQVQWQDGALCFQELGLYDRLANTVSTKPTGDDNGRTSTSSTSTIDYPVSILNDAHHTQEQRRRLTAYPISNPRTLRPCGLSIANADERDRPILWAKGHAVSITTRRQRRTTDWLMLTWSTTTRTTGSTTRAKATTANAPDLDGWLQA
ncbi:hypothetical protein DFP72DRAFT_1101957 [Ephemerocybe angulata]|uniref:Uncharacterized protein n=1 Tax=Ephemerocybe angulata TaxID=980116 RepID=A0A8H6H9Y6_9AGAR|nr:hypothetical protein DFP72DRAFT_1101957 [Tulosesus angulatus]